MTLFSLPALVEGTTQPLAWAIAMPMEGQGRARSLRGILAPAELKLVRPNFAKRFTLNVPIDDGHLAL